MIKDLDKYYEVLKEKFGSNRAIQIQYDQSTPSVNISLYDSTIVMFQSVFGFYMIENNRSFDLLNQVFSFLWEIKYLAERYTFSKEEAIAKSAKMIWPYFHTICMNGRDHKSCDLAIDKTVSTPPTKEDRETIDEDFESLLGALI